MSDSAASSTVKGAGLAITAIVLVILGICFFPIALVGLVFAIIAIVRGKGWPRVVGIVSVAVGLVVPFTGALMLGLMLPALGKARETARTVKSGVQATVIVQSLITEVVISEREFPELASGAPNLEAFLTSVGPENWVSPAADTPDAGTSFVFLPPTPGQLAKLDPTLPVLVENPDVVDAGNLNICFGDGSTSLQTREKAIRLLEAAQPRVFQTNGKPWRR